MNLAKICWGENYASSHRVLFINKKQMISIFPNISNVYVIMASELVCHMMIIIIGYIHIFPIEDKLGRYMNKLKVYDLET